MSRLSKPQRRSQRLRSAVAATSLVAAARRRRRAVARRAASPVFGVAPPQPAAAAAAAAQFDVHVGQLAAELASGDAVQEEVDGVVGVHELEADGAQETVARDAARVADVDQRAAEEYLQRERRREHEPRERDGQQHVRHPRRHRRLRYPAAAAAAVVASGTARRDADRVAAAETQDDRDVESEYDGERRQRVRRQLDVLELVAHEPGVRRRAAVRQRAPGDAVQPGRPEEMDAGGGDDDDEAEDGETGAPSTADGGGAQRQPDGDESIDRRQDDQPGGNVEHHVEQERHQTARRVGHVHQLETGHLHGRSQPNHSAYTAVIVLNKLL